MKGKVKWFNDKLGYGFIESRFLEKDIFIHFSEINMKGYKKLSEGDIVEFDYDKESNKAVNLNIIKKTNNYRNNEMIRREFNNSECIQTL